MSPLSAPPRYPLLICSVIDQDWEIGNISDGSDEDVGGDILHTNDLHLHMVSFKGSAVEQLGN